MFFLENRSQNNSNKAWKMEYLISSKKKYVNERASFKIWRLQSTRSTQTWSVLFRKERETEKEEEDEENSVNFTGFPFLLFFPFHKRNSRNFLRLLFYNLPSKRIVSTLFFFQEQNLNPSFDYEQVSMHL